MTQRCMAQQCMTVWSLECDLTMATTTLMLTQITQSTSSAAACPAQMWPVLTVASSSQHRQCQAPSSTQVASMCSDRSTSTVQYSTVLHSTVHSVLASLHHVHCTTLQAGLPSTSLHPQHVCVLCQCTAVYRKCRMYPNFSMYPSFLDPKLVERFKIFHSFCQVDIFVL